MSPMKMAPSTTLPTLPDPAAQTPSADDACRNRIEWHRGADICLAGFKPRGQQSPRYRGEGSAQHIGQKQVEPRVNTGETRSLDVPADRVKVTAHTGPIEQNEHSYE